LDIASVTDVSNHFRFVSRSRRELREIFDPSISGGDLRVTGAGYSGVMRKRTLAHLSDLHLGRSRDVERSAARLCRALLDARVDHAIVTGDVTDRGRRAELLAFERAFAPLIDSGRLTVVPGNHDRLGDDVASTIARGRRVSVVTRPGLHLVVVDSTGAHNRSLLAGHGELGARDLDAIDEAIDGAAADALVVVALHHHPMRLPEELFIERVSGWLGMPNAAELALGPALLGRLRGRCDLVLHGHRHQPRAAAIGLFDARPLGIYNAGSTTLLGAARLLAHAGGRLAGEAEWLRQADADEVDVAPPPPLVVDLGAALARGAA
jgi:predicted phosphodiesterase